ncbi:FAD-dependent catabolic D-arginine dehydrogenase DauA [bacterium HR30]|nr:FAD-dependent catabolic D-arginine dehydrogenase DauA [bacterium HR30]
MNTADVVIVGAGFAGAATAFHLARQGVKNIIVLERERIPGYHASGRNAALGFSSIAAPEAATLAREGLDFIRTEAAALAGRSIFRPCGSLLIASQENTGRDLRAMLPHLDGGSAWWSADEVFRALPILQGANFLGAVWAPQDGVVDIHALLELYLKGATSRGAQVFYCTPVLAITAAQGQTLEVRTPAGSWSCAAVVNAAGAWATEIGRLAGSPLLPLEPRRRHLFVGKPHIQVDPHWPFVWHADVDTYFRPEGDGLLLSPCDATPHPAVEPTTDENSKLLLAEKLERAFPQLADLAIAQAWACLRTFAPDERFVIGPDPEIQGFLWVAGLGGHGMTTSAAVGRLAAAALLGEKSEELGWFSPARLVQRGS